MRVLHIIDTLWLGGVQTLERDYFEIQRGNNDIFLYVLRKSVPQLTIDHKNVFIYDSYRSYSFSPIFKLRRFIKENNIDTLHCQLVRSHLFGYLLKRLFFPKIKLIIHEQGDVIDTAWLSLPLMKLMKHKVNLFIACSNALRNILIEKANIEPTGAVTLYNAVYLQKFNRQNITWNVSEERKKIGIEKNEFVIGFAGRLIERKGWREFIEVAKMLQYNTSVKFVIASDGIDKEKMLRLIASYKLNNVIYKGYVSNMPLFYSWIDCLTVPSHHEPMGMIVPEAQAMEVPVIAANVDGLNEIVTNGENALLFKPRNITGLKFAIMKLIEDKALQARLKLNGYENAKKYSIENYAKTLHDIYFKIS